MFFLSMFFSLLQVMTKQVVWIDTVIEIPLGEPLSSYIDRPQATLYIDGEAVVDPFMYYEKDGVERTFFSVVDTDIVKDYVIKYRVTFPSYHAIYTESITFKVIDTIPPSVTYVPVFAIAVGAQLPDLSKDLRYHDNYDEPSMINLVIEHQVIRDVVGTYVITYHVIDQSNNVTTRHTELVVFDPLPPNITQKKPLVIAYGSQWQWQDYFTITDNVDTNPLVEIDDQAVSYDRPGTYPIVIIATDQSGLSKVFSTEIRIIDQTPPMLILSKNPMHLTVHVQIEMWMLKRYIIEVTDDCDVLSVDDVSILHDIDIDRLGKYTIHYRVSDTSGNTTSSTLSIHVIDDVAPTITLEKPLLIDVFESDIDFKSFITYQDNYDPNHVLMFEVKGDYDLNEVDSYPLMIEVTDTSKNKGVLWVELMIIDHTPPQISLKSDIVITDYQPRNLEHYVDITDNYDDLESLMVVVDDQTVNYANIGLYEATVCAKDLSENESCLTFDVMVVDITPPELELSTDYMTIDITQSAIDWLDLITICKDDYQLMSKQDVLITHDINWHVIGRYPVIFSLTDTSKNTTIRILYVTIDALETITYHYQDTTYLSHQAIDFMQDVTVHPYILPHQITYQTDHVDYDVPGQYEVTYVITDARGRSKIFQRIITIEAEPEHFDFVDYAPLVIANLILAGFGYVYIKRRL